MNTRFLIAVLCATCTATVLADKVTLKSGSFLTGTAGEIAGDRLKFKSDDLGEVEIAVANIAALESERPHVIQYKDLTTVTKPVSIRDGAYVVGADRLDMADVKAIDPKAETWHGSVNFAYQSAHGNTYDTTGSLIAEANRRWEKDRVKANFGYHYSESGASKRTKEKSTDRWELEGQHDHFWRPTVYSYTNARWEKDDIAGLDYRLRLGLGGGYQWLDKRAFDATGRWSFSQEAGAAWVKSSFADKDPDADDSYASVRYAHHLAYLPKWATGGEVFHNFEYLPQVNDWENHLAKADLGFTTKIIMNFDLLAKVEWDYNSRPSVGRKSSDTRYVIGLGYKW
ncbi:MAG: YdiY family protein [Kiritimatiellia bacterium]